MSEEPASATVERRQVERLRMTIPVTLQDGSIGRMRDITSLGAYFEIERPVPLGASIAFSISMEHVDPRGPVDVRYKGTVVRIERHDDKVGVAVAIESYQL